MGLIVAAAIATSAALALGALALWLTPRSDWRLLVFVFAVSLPLHPLAFVTLRDLLNDFFGSLLPAGGILMALSLLYAPLTEEPAKWLVFASKTVRSMLRPDNTVPFALALGAGFGIGEIWFLALWIFLSPNYPDLPFWGFWGFMLERPQACLLHAFFVVVPILRLVQGQSFWPGALIGVGLHLLANLPIPFVQSGMLGMTPATRSYLLLVWVTALTAGAAYLMWRLHAELTAMAARLR